MPFLNVIRYPCVPVHLLISVAMLDSFPPIQLSVSAFLSLMSVLIVPSWFGECVYTLLYQRPLLRLYECNVNIIHSNGICESKQGFKNGRDVNINFFIVQIYFVFCYLKLTLYYCEVRLSVLSLL